MKPNSKVKDAFFRISAMLILVAAVMFYFDVHISRWIMIFGVAGYAACTFTTPYPGKALRGKRLFNIQILAVILMAVAAYILFIGRMEWVVLLLISAILTLYSTYAMGATFKKEQEEDLGK